MSQERETRSIASTFETDGKKLVGYAAVFNSPSQVMRERGRTFTEIIRPGAFTKALASGGDIISTFNHDPSRLLGRTSSGTLRLTEDERGLRFEVDLPESAADVRELVQRGDLNGASFAFAVRQGGEKWDADHQTRELTDLYLAELGPVVQPAYPATSVGLRSTSVRRKLVELWGKV